ncbi:MAG: sigma-70 family RNA polymerase sigma factor [Clostridia bacterium]|nr:sigma-70 family RNA polymerase sigma factor [Clostridia bacterium]
MYKDLSDAQLSALHKEGDQEAFGEIYVRYATLVRKLARGYFLLGGDSDDLAQEGLLGLLRAANTYDESKNASFKTYATTCILSKLKTAVRLYSSKGNEPLNFAEKVEGGDVVYPDPEEIYIDVENGIEFENRLKESLSEMELKILNYYLNGMSYAEISRAIASPVKTVDNALHRAKKKISAFYNR